LAAWVGDYAAHIMVAQAPFGSCPMCEIPVGATIRHSTVDPLDQSRDQHICLELLKEPNLDTLHPLVFIQFTTSSGNTLFATSITDGSLMNCIM